MSKLDRVVGWEGASREVEMSEAGFCIVQESVVFPAAAAAAAARRSVFLRDTQRTQTMTRWLRLLRYALRLALALQLCSSTPPPI